MVDTETVEELKVPFPHIHDTEAIASFIRENEGKKGQKTFVRGYSQYQYHSKHLELALDTMRRGHNRLNNISTSGQRKAGAKRSVEYHARKMFDKMSDAQQRRACLLFELDYNSFDTVEERVEALVKAHVGGNGQAL